MPTGKNGKHEGGGRHGPGRSSSRKNVSAGLLLYRRTTAATLEVFLAHPGGPFWANKDDGAWTIPKGLLDDGEEPLAAALREFQEETGLTPTAPYLPLGTRQADPWMGV